LEPLVTGLIVPLGPLMQGLLETPGHTVAGHLVHGQVKVVPRFRVVETECFEYIQGDAKTVFYIIGNNY
jgi:hypothetical protein